MVLRVGLIGYGTIGKYVARRLLDKKTLPGASLVAALVQNERSEIPKELAQERVLFTHQPDVFFQHDFDVVVEAAGQPAVGQYGTTSLARAKLMITSVGALCNDALHNELLGVARANGTQLLIAAGSMAGMDWMSSAAFEHLENVSVVQIKTPNGWLGTPAEEKVDLMSLTGPETIFEGTAREAATLYPKNANISAALALATVGLDCTNVRLVADPTIAGPMSRIRLAGDAGEILVEVRGKASPGNPRTSYVVPLSVVKALRNLSGPEFVGI